LFLTEEESPKEDEVWKEKRRQIELKFEGCILSVIMNV
jgi:hypothetical protein